MLRRYGRPTTLLFLGLWLVLMLAGRGRLLRDPGTLWHIVVGEQILARGELVYADDFSFTRAGAPWIAQQWLGECALALLHRVGGLDTVVLATATLLACLYAWLGHRLVRAGMHPLLAALVVALAVMASSYHFHPRPHLVTLVLLGWTFARLCDVEAGRASLRSLLWLVPLCALWANVHGGMVGGVATVALTGLGWVLARRAGWESPLTNYRQGLLLAGLVVACALTALLNPYGVELPRVWFALMGSPLLPRIIQEHAPLLSAGAVAWAVLAFGLVYLAALLGVLPRKPRVTWLIPLVWLGLAFTRVRHAPLFVLTASLALAEMYPFIRWREWMARKGSVTCRLWTPDPGAPGPRGAWEVALLPGLVVLTALTLEAAAVPLPLLGRGWARFDPGDSAVELLPELRAYEKARPAGTPVFNEMSFGGFLIYFTPGLKVFVDDRCELYGDRRLASYAEAYYHHPERIEGWAREYGFDRALVAPGSAFDRYLGGAGGWVVVRRSAGAALYRRTTPHPPAPPADGKKFPHGP